MRWVRAAGGIAVAIVVTAGCGTGEPGDGSATATSEGAAPVEPSEPATTGSPSSDPDVTAFRCDRIIDESWPANEANFRVRATITNSTAPDPLVYDLSYNVLDSSGAIIASGSAETLTPLSPGKTLKIDDVYGVATGEELVLAAGRNVSCELSGVQKIVK